LPDRVPPPFGLVAAEPRGDAPPPSKNRVGLYQVPDRGRVLVKSPGPAGPAGICHEAAVLAAIAPLAGDGRCPLRVPEVYAADARRGLLAVRWIDGAESLHSFHRRTGRHSPAMGAAIGRALGWLHGRAPPGLDPQAENVPRDDDFASFFTHVRPATYARLARATISLISAVQHDAGAVAGLLAIGRWRGGERWLHGDLKPANIVRLPGKRPMLLLVDWERSVPGDPARDLGSLLAEYLARRLAPDPGERPVASGTLAAFVAALLAAYREERGPGEPPAPDFGERLGRWTGLGLLYCVVARIHQDGLFSERERLLAAHGRDLLARPEAGLLTLLGTRW